MAALVEDMAIAHTVQCARAIATGCYSTWSGPRDRQAGPVVLLLLARFDAHLYRTFGLPHHLQQVSRGVRAATADDPPSARARFRRQSCFVLGATITTPLLAAIARTC
jgi:hypothetical protein